MYFFWKNGRISLLIGLEHQSKRVQPIQFYPNYPRNRTPMTSSAWAPLTSSSSSSSLLAPVFPLQPNKWRRDGQPQSIGGFPPRAPGPGPPRRPAAPARPRPGIAFGTWLHIVLVAGSIYQGAVSPHFFEPLNYVGF